MEFEALTPKIGMFHHNTNIGIFCTNNDLYLIDTGSSEKDGKCLLSNIKDLFPNKQIKAILNTHSHSDHCGGNAFIKKETGCEVWAAQKESLLMQIPEAMSFIYWGGFPIEELQSQKFITQDSTFIEKILKEEQIDLGEIKITCISLPGHCFDQLGYVVLDVKANKSVFFLGDGFFGASFLKKYWIPFMYNPQLFRDSVKKIEETFADIFVPSHGDTYNSENIHAIAELNVIVTLETETLILKTLKKASLTTEELLEAVADFAGIDLRLSQFILIGCTLRSYLSELYNSKKITFKIEDNRLLWSIC